MMRIAGETVPATEQSKGLKFVAAIAGGGTSFAASLAAAPALVTKYIPIVKSIDGPKVASVVSTGLETAVAGGAVKKIKDAPAVGYRTPTAQSKKDEPRPVINIGAVATLAQEATQTEESPVNGESAKTAAGSSDKGSMQEAVTVTAQNAVNDSGASLAEVGVEHGAASATSPKEIAVSQTNPTAMQERHKLAKKVVGEVDAAGVAAGDGRCAPMDSVTASASTVSAVAIATTPDLQAVILDVKKDAAVRLPAGGAVAGTKIAKNTSIGVRPASDIKTASRPEGSAQSVVTHVAGVTDDTPVGSQIGPAVKAEIVAGPSVSGMHSGTVAVQESATPHPGGIQSLARSVTTEAGSNLESPQASRHEIGGAVSQGLMTATATTLEVGVTNGTHGWMKVRASMEGGVVTASISARSSQGLEMLHREMPSLTTYLQGEGIAVSALAVAKAAADGSSGVLGGGTTGRGGGDSTAGREQRATSAEIKGQPIWSSDDTVGLDDGGAATVLLPGLHSGSGGWLNVRV